MDAQEELTTRLDKIDRSLYLVTGAWTVLAIIFLLGGYLIDSRYFFPILFLVVVFWLAGLTLQLQVARRFRQFTADFIQVKQQLTQREKQLAALSEKQKMTQDGYHLHAQVFESLHDGVAIFDEQTNFISVNAAFCQMMGYTPEELLGRPMMSLDAGRFSADYYWQMMETAQGAEHWQGELWSQRKDGTIFPQWLSLSTLRDEDGVLTHYVGVYIDISNRVSLEEYLQHVATHDQLTGLLNRESLQERLQYSITKAKNERKRLAVIFLDLDGFKTINDRYGHNNGDLLLQLVAERFNRCTRDRDTVARISGDEFGWVLEHLNTPQDAAGAARRILSVLAEPFSLDGVEVSLSASLGISLYPDDAQEAERLIKLADKAMYAVKKNGKNGYGFISSLVDDLRVGEIETVAMK